MLAQVLMLLGSAVFVVLVFQRLRYPSSLACLLIGLLSGPRAAGPVAGAPPLLAPAGPGVVFLLFAIGLNFSLPQIHALRHEVLGEHGQSVTEDLLCGNLTRHALADGGADWLVSTARADTAG